MSLNLTADRTDSALSRLCSATPEVFRDQIWARRAWLSQAAELPDQDIFSTAAVDELLSRRGLRTPFLRMAKNGRVIPSRRFTGSGGTGAAIADQVRDDDVLRLFADGSTIVLQGLHRTWEPVNRLAGELAAELGHPVQVNAYVTPAQNQGFDPHYDTHDVFVLQVSGRKQWTVHEPVVQAPTQPWDTVSAEVAARAAEPPILDTELRPGDCLYLPRGFIHSATAVGATSVHLTFGIHSMTHADVARAVLDEVLTDGWRESLPAGFDPTDADDVLGPFIDRLAAAIGSVDINQVGTRLADRRGSAQRPEPILPVAQAEAAANLSADDVVRLRRFLSVRVAPNALQLPGGREINFTDADRPAMDILLTGHPVRVQDVPCDPETIAGLLREGILVIGSQR